MRYTKRYETGYEIRNELKNFGGADLFVPVCSNQDIVNKFGVIEDIEERLGVGLDVLIKALEQDTLFVKTDLGIKETLTKKKDSWSDTLLTCEDGELVIITNIFYPDEFLIREILTPIKLHLKDYGISWALTKEELDGRCR